MNKISIILFLFITGVVGRSYSQTALNVYTNNAPRFSILVADVDSIFYSNIAPENLTIYVLNSSMYYQFLIADIDSINYSTPVIPSITSLPVNSITDINASSGGNITFDGGANVTARGVCYGVTPNPSLLDQSSLTQDGSGTGSYSSSLDSLLSNQLYYVRAYATNIVGTAYGNEISFTTSTLSNLPILTTTSVTSITCNSVQCGGIVTSGNGSFVSVRGVCWSTSPNPTVDLITKTSDGMGNGTFTSNVFGLDQNQVYYIRAYATSSNGTSYGQEFSFSTLEGATITTIIPLNISITTAESGGVISSDGGSAVTTRGVVWSTTINPTTNLSTRTWNGAGTGTFSSSITGLLPNQAYHIRAYAISASGTSYGEDLIFTTLPTPLLPVLTTNAITNITYNGATMGGNITNSGTTAVSSRGVCWDTSPSPTSGLATSLTIGSGVGSFTGNVLNSLLGNTTYYVRAFATNSNGTSYGNEIVFTTAPSVLPVLGTASYYGFTMISYTTTDGTATCSVTSDGGAPITEKGFCWGATIDPTIDLNSNTQLGPGSTPFTSSILGLSMSTDYYFRPYAINSVGITYGASTLVTTPTPTPPPAINFPPLNYGTVTDIDGNTYNTILIGSQTWMAENLRTTKYSNGDPIPLITDNTLWYTSTTDAYTFYNNNISNTSVYGNLYNYKVAKDLRNACPVGWRVPTIGDWNTLIYYNGGNSTAADSLKEDGTVHWNSNNSTNPKGFSVLGAGYRSDVNGTFALLKGKSYFWTSTPFNTGTGYNVKFTSSSVVSTTVLSVDSPSRLGSSIRCIME